MHGVIVALILKGSAVLLGLLLSLQIANNIGADGSGVFYLTFTLVIIFSSITRFGTDQSLVKYINICKSDVDSDSLILWVLLIVFCFSGLVTLTTFFFHKEISYLLFGDEVISEYIRLASPAIMFTSLYIALSVCLQAKGLANQYVICVSLLMPLFTFVGVSISGTESVSHVFYIFNTSCFISLFVSTILLARTISSFNSQRGFHLLKRLMKTTVFFSVIGIIVLLNQWMSQLMLGRYMELSDVGVFSAAQRVSFLFTSITVAINGVYSGKLISLTADNDPTHIYSIVKKIFFTASVIGLSALFVLSLFSFQVLEVFGDEFVMGENVLRVLSLSQFVYLFPCVLSWLLIAKNKQVLLLVSSLLMLGVNLSLNYLLIPNYGMIGAACAQLSAFFAYFVVVCILLKKYIFKQYL